MHSEYLVKAVTCKEDVGLWSQCSRSSLSIIGENIHICMHFFQNAERTSMQYFSDRSWETNLSWILQSGCHTCSACSPCFAQPLTYKDSYMSFSWGELCLLGCTCLQILSSSHKHPHGDFSLLLSFLLSLLCLLARERSGTYLHSPWFHLIFHF